MNNLLNLNSKYIGQNCLYFEKIDSTQSEIWRKISENNIENGTLAIADIQTNGKGTHGRIWHTDEKDNIAFSTYVETDNSNIENFENITVDIAKILVEIFKENYNINIEIKFPNDLMINNKKIGGILTESKISNGKMKYLVIGVGINTNKKSFSDDISNIATSISKEYGIKINRFEIISEFCNKLEIYLNERIDK